MFQKNHSVTFVPKLRIKEELNYLKRKDIFEKVLSYKCGIHAHLNKYIPTTTASPHSHIKKTNDIHDSNFKLCMKKHKSPFD